MGRGPTETYGQEKVDPIQELQRQFSARAAAAIARLPSQTLGPGMRVRLAAALKAVASTLERRAKVEAQGHLSKRKRRWTDAGVEFYPVPEESKPALRTEVAAELLPQKKYPQAWGTSNTGGNVSITLGALDDE